MTMHSAKGLEFKHVYIVGMEDTLFPSPMSSGSARELEEERRLFYVAVTRAEKQATLSYALNRYKWGNLERCSPSSFLVKLIRNFFIIRRPEENHSIIPVIQLTKSQSVREEPKQYIKGRKV